MNTRVDCVPCVNTAALLVAAMLTLGEVRYLCCVLTTECEQSSGELLWSACS